MRIVQIGSYPLDPLKIKGGIEASVYGIAQALSTDNEVDVICLPDRSLKEDTSKLDGSVRVNYLRNPYGKETLRVLCVSKIVRMINKDKVDVVHIHESSLMTLLLIIYLRFKKINHVVTIHGILYIETWKQFLKTKSLLHLLFFFISLFADFLILNLCKKIIVDTEYVSIELSKMKKKAYHVIPQGIGDFFFEMPDDYDKNKVLSIGAISPRKGYEYSILAIEQLLLTYSKGIKYQIVGTVSHGHEKYLEHLLDLIDSKKLSDSVIITPNVQLHEVHSALQKCNLFILHSMEESQGIAFCEAMAAGKPIVATNVGGIPYVVRNNINGLLSEYSDVRKFAGNMRAILESDETRNSMSLKGKELARQYSWKIIAGQVLSVYQGV